MEKNKIVYFKNFTAKEIAARIVQHVIQYPSKLNSSVLISQSASDDAVIVKFVKFGSIDEVWAVDGANKKFAKELSTLVVTALDTAKKSIDDIIEETGVDIFNLSGKKDYSIN